LGKLFEIPSYEICNILCGLFNLGCFIAIRSIEENLGYRVISGWRSKQSSRVRQLTLEYVLGVVRVLSVARGLINSPPFDDLGMDRDWFVKEVADRR
jgi:hypothetical protein